MTAPLPPEEEAAPAAPDDDPARRLVHLYAALADKVVLLERDLAHVRLEYGREARDAAKAERASASGERWRAFGLGVLLTLAVWAIWDGAMAPRPGIPVIRSR